MKTELGKSSEAGMYQARYWGMRMEYQNPPNKLLSHLILAGTKAFEHIEQPSIVGKLPSHGPGLVLFTHYHWLDIPVLVTAAMQAGRSLRFVGRNTLIDANAQEDPVITERFGKKDTFNSNSYMGRAARRMTEALCRTYEVIPTPREKITRDFLDQISDAFKRNQLVALSLFATRNPQRGLRDAKAGSTVLARMHPTVPIITAALWYADHRKRNTDEHSVNLVIDEEPFTYNDIPFPAECDDKLRFAYQYIVGKIALSLPPDLKTEWIKKYGDAFPPKE